MSSTLIARAKGIYGRATALADLVRSPLLAVIRIHFGYQLFLAGSGKLADIAGTAGFFASLGIPAPTLNAYLASTTEVVGGLLLLAGLLARPAALAVAGTMAVAYITAHAEAVREIVASPDGFTSADPFLFLLTAVLVLAFGPGAISLDALIGRILAAREPGARAEPGESDIDGRRLQRAAAARA